MRFASASIGICLLASPAFAATGFVGTPSTNSSDWTNAAIGAGHTIETFYDFDAAASGDGLAQLNAAYVGLGVTVTGTGSVNTIQTDGGPGQGNIDAAIPGEGVFTPSSYLLMGAEPSELIFTFDNLVYGAGIFTLDVFQDSGLQIEAFTGVDGTGASLGLFDGSTANFQNNNVYFMGLISEIGFRSFVFRDTVNNGGDTFGVDDLVFLSSPGTPVPLPAGAALLPAPLAGFALLGRRRA